RHTRFDCDWSSDVCSSDLAMHAGGPPPLRASTTLAALAVRFTLFHVLCTAFFLTVSILRVRTVALHQAYGGTTKRAVRGRKARRSEERRVGKECRARGGGE